MQQSKNPRDRLIGNMGSSRIDIGKHDLVQVALGLWTHNAITLNLDVYQGRAHAGVCLTPRQARRVAEALNGWAASFESYQREQA